jgi:probable HAF family extracellular repeat protein
VLFRSQIVCNANGTSLGEQIYHAFIYDDSSMKDLNTLLDSSGAAGWTLMYAEDINENGQIVGLMKSSSGLASYHAFLLTPVPEPSTIAFLITGAFGLLAHAWRRR